MIYAFYKVCKEDIYQIKNLLEAYENILNVSTIDEAISKIQITIAPDFLTDAENILKDLETRFQMQRLEEPSHLSQGVF